jgi:hemerythrin-like domain-containing protein
MDLFQLLKNDHQKVKDILQNIISDCNNTQLFKELEEEIALHNETEERIFYTPLKRKSPKLAMAIENGVEEHELVMRLFDQLHEQDLNAKEKQQLLTMIKRSIEAHIEKEENEVFSLAQELFSSEEISFMAEKWNKTKAELKQKMPNETSCNISSDEEMEAVL